MKIIFMKPMINFKYSLLLFFLTPLCIYSTEPYPEVLSSDCLHYTHLVHVIERRPEKIDGTELEKESTFDKENTSLPISEESTVSTPSVHAEYNASPIEHTEYSASTAVHTEYNVSPVVHPEYSASPILETYLPAEPIESLERHDDHELLVRDVHILHVEEAPSFICHAKRTNCRSCCVNPWSSFSLGYTYGRGIETRKNYASTNLLLFPKCFKSPFFPFFSFSSHCLNHHKWAGSLGACLRWKGPGSWGLGANLFYDTIKKSLGTYHQVGAGVEFLSCTWEARVNAYIPVGNKERLKRIAFFNNYVGGYFIKVNKLEQTNRGFDAEIGRNLFLNKDFRFYAGLGPAWFEKSNWKEKHWAFKGRAFMNWKRRVTCEVRVFKQSNERWHWQGVATITMPLDCWATLCPCWLSDLFSQPVYRNAMIKTSNDCCWQKNF
jgi:Inverse autotransporter, beta-domain